MNFIEQARKFAHEAHDSIGQKRKYSGEPYWVHTDEVADIVAKYCADEPNLNELIAAANSHDVLEDVYPKNPFYGPTEISNRFGANVYKIVHELTDVYTKENYPKLNRRERKALEAQRIAKISNGAKMIKLADLISNSKDILRQDPAFARVYLAEKLVLLEGLEGVNQELFNLALNQANEVFNLLLTQTSKGV
jgi:(p)ppGpp synthase/HD superfamily hydrolase